MRMISYSIGNILYAIYINILYINNIYTSICMYVCKYACMFVCMYVYTYVCMYVCMYVHILHMESLAQERVSDTDDLLSINMCWVIRCFTLPVYG